MQKETNMVKNSYEDKNTVEKAKLDYLESIRVVETENDEKTSEFGGFKSEQERIDTAIKYNILDPKRLIKKEDGYCYIDDMLAEDYNEVMSKKDTGDAYRID